jgi:hypothetical protein
MMLSDNNIDERNYYVMRDGEQVGPFLLSSLPDEGVAPDTYVWCKGMDKWQRAKDVADICRLMRQRLSASSTDKNIEKTIADDEQLNSSRLPELPEIISENVNYDVKPHSFIVEALVVSLFCFPPTGFVALYNAGRGISLWKASVESKNREEIKSLREECYECSVRAKMWTGITFFLGFIVMAVLFRLSGG